MNAIEKAPEAVRATLLLEPVDRLRLNEALLSAQLKAAEARELGARLELARRDAILAAQRFEQLRDQVGASVGVRLGVTHGWDAATGEIRELQQVQ